MADITAGVSPHKVTRQTLPRPQGLGAQPELAEQGSLPPVAAKTSAGTRGTWEPILTDDQHQRLRLLLNNPARSFNSPGETFHGKRTLSGGLLVYGLCGKPLKPQVHLQTVWMVCHKLNAKCGRVVIKHDPLEEFVLDRVVAAVAKNERWIRRMTERPAVEASALKHQRRALNEQAERANDPTYRAP